MGLDAEIRARLEEIIDNILRDKAGIEKSISVTLEAQGIEASLETILSFIAGDTFGVTTGMYYLKHGRSLNEDEMLHYLQILKRRAWELRQAFISTRII